MVTTVLSLASINANSNGLAKNLPLHQQGQPVRTQMIRSGQRSPAVLMLRHSTSKENEALVTQQCYAADHARTVPRIILRSTDNYDKQLQSTSKGNRAVIRL